MTLFRDAAIDEQRLRLHGEVTIHQPVAFGVITGSLFAFTLTAIAVAGLATFSRREMALGWIAPEMGMAEAYAPAGAIVQAVEVKVGQSVVKGQVLGSVFTETYDAAGGLGEHEARQINAQQAELNAQILAVRRRTRTEEERVRAQAAAVSAVIAGIERSKQVQQAQVALSRNQFEAAAPLVKRGFITKIEQDRREAAYLAGKQSLIELDQQAAGQRAQLAAFEAQITAARNQQEFDLAQLRMTQANLRSNALGVAARSGVTLRAPMAGMIASVNARAGETAKPGLALISIAPPGRLGAEAFIPTRSSGFVKVGQKVRLFVDAFPFQKYGSLNGVIEEIGHAAIIPGEYGIPVKVAEPSYRMKIRIDRSNDNIQRNIALQAGMTVSASITTERQTLLEWLFEPLAKASATLAN